MIDSWRRLGEGWSPLLTEPPLTLALEHLEPVVGAAATVLDAGSGTGHVASVLAAHGARVVALDVHEASVLATRTRFPNIMVVVARVEEIPIRSCNVDAIFSSSVLQYSARGAALSEFSRVLRPNGRISILENLFGNPFARAYRRWLRREIGIEPHQIHREHLRWNGRQVYDRYFRATDYTAFHVLVPALAVFSAVTRPTGVRRPRWLTRAVVSIVHGVDKLLLRIVPGAASIAWTVVVRGRR
jgi:SAM-dependent methyltransferase